MIGEQQWYIEANRCLIHFATPLFILFYFLIIINVLPTLVYVTYFFNVDVYIALLFGKH